MSTVTIADRLPADELVFDAPKFRELEAARTANGLGPKDHEAMRPLSEQSGAFHPYLGRWVDGDKSGLNGYKNYAGSLLSVGERLAELCAGTDSDRINRSTYYASLPWMKRYLNGRKTLAGKNAGQPLTATNRSKIAGHFTTMAKRDQVEFLAGEAAQDDGRGPRRRPSDAHQAHIDRAPGVRRDARPAAHAHRRDWRWRYGRHPVGMPRRRSLGNIPSRAG